MNRRTKARVRALKKKLEAVTGSTVGLPDLKETMVIYALDLVENDFATFLRCHASKRPLTKENENDEPGE